MTELLLETVTTSTSTPEPTSEPTKLDRPERLKTEAEKSAPREPWVEIAQDERGWHWVLWAGNGQALCVNPRPYESQKHAIQAVQAVQKNWACVTKLARVR